jgi:RNA polymerase sigma-70 factor (ECF subfamily)
MDVKQLRKQLYKLDRLALTELVEKYRLPLTAFAFTYVRDEFLAEDIVSETIVRLLLKEPKLKNESALKTYLFSTAKHLAIDLLRKKKREKALVVELKKERDLELSWFVENSLVETEERKALLTAIGRLGEDYRETLYLHYFEEMSIEDIAKTMKKSKKQIYNLLARAKKSLSEKFDKGGERNEND